MKFALQLKIMVAALRKSGARAVMAVICVGLGIGSIMVAMALGSGAEREMQSISENAGKNILVVKAAAVQTRAGAPRGWIVSTKLRQSDGALIASQVDGIKAVIPVSDTDLKVKATRIGAVTSVKGVTPEYFATRNFQIANGRIFDEDENAAKSRVAVVGPFVARKINENQNLVGQSILIAGTPYEVIGQLKEKGVNRDGTNDDDQVLIPVDTALRRILNVEFITSFIVQVKTEQQIFGVQNKIREILRVAHGLDAGVKDDFEILSLIKANAIRRLSDQFLQGISQLFAVVTLGIGGAGVFAVTYLNVKDRTAEIGLRMAIGAKRRDIALLFVAEACLLSFIGGLVGIAIGACGVLILKSVTDWEMAIGISDVAGPFAISVLLGLLFGVVPAMKASKMMPVEALRAS